MNVSHEVLHSKITEQLCKAARTTSPEFSSVAATCQFLKALRELNFERFIKLVEF